MSKSGSKGFSSFVGGITKSEKKNKLLAKAAKTEAAAASVPESTVLF
jgi:hypothetical protein